MNFKDVTFPDHLSFACKNCGRCCQEQPADATVAERKRIDAEGFTDYLDEHDLSEPRLIKSRKSGGCFFLKENTCSIHGVKPAICRLVPFEVVDWDYEHNLIEVDLPADCACPGVSDGDQLPVETLAKAAHDYVYGLLEVTAKEANLPTTDKRVQSRTRMLIIRLATETEK